MSINPEQMQRRAERWEHEVVPSWGRRVDPVALELLRGVPLTQAPTVLVAECRTGHLVQDLIEILPERARLMAVDSSSEMLDRARDRLRSSNRRIFYSSQPTTRLSYADGVFHAVLCTHGLLTRGDLRLAGSELLRVLRREGLLCIAVPMRETFACFQHTMRESLVRLEMRDVEQSLEDYLAALVDERTLHESIAELELEIVDRREVHFELAFDSAEAFLFSPLVEDLYLPRWLAIGDDPGQREPLFFDIVRSLNTWFRGMALTTHASVACLLLRRRP